MRSLIILAVVAFALALADDTLIRQRRDARRGGYGFSYSEARIAGHEMRLHQLNEMLHKLEEKVEAGDDSVPDSMHILENRLDHIEGDDCGPRMRSCGRHSGQCISQLSMCDQHDDCKNHYDEDEHTCENRAPAGRSWSGHAEWTNCLVRSNNQMTILITGNKRYDHFPHILFVNAAIVEDYTVAGHKEHTTWYTHGTYDFEAQRIHLDPPEGSTARIGTVCSDAGPRMANCQFIRESDGTVCGHATLTRGG